MKTYSETTPAAECHFNFAQPVIFQLCADAPTPAIGQRANVSAVQFKTVSLSGVLAAVGGGIDGGAEHERWGVAASRGLAGRRSRPSGQRAYALPCDHVGRRRRVSLQVRRDIDAAAAFTIAGCNHRGA